MIRPKILFIDDSPTTRALAEAALEEAGYRVMACADAETGLRGAAVMPGPRAMVVDTYLPGTDVVVLVARLRILVPRSPLLALLERDSPVDHQLEQQLRAEAYLIKPFAPRQLVATVQEVLQLPANVSA